MQELLQKPTDLRNVRLANFMQKKSSSTFGGWGKRYIVLSANFVFVYKAPTDDKPRRVICVDDCTVKANDELRGVANGFTLTTRAKQPYHFACESSDDRAKWITALTNAGYSSMYTRTREAVKFLDKCREIVAPLAIAIERAVEKGASPEEAALTAVTDGLEPEAVEARKAAMSGADVVQVLAQLRAAQAWAASTLSSLKARVGELEKEADEADREAEEAVAARDEAQGALGRAQDEAEAGRRALEQARLDSSRSTAEVAALSSRVSELSARNAELAGRVEDLSRELAGATQAAARAVRVMGGGGTGGAEAAGSGVEEAAALRARVAALEAAISREREATAGQVKTLQHALENERRRGLGGSAVAAGSPQAPIPASPPPRYGYGGPAASPPSHSMQAAPVAAGPVAYGAHAHASASAAGGTGGVAGMGMGMGSASSDPAVVYEREWAPFYAEAQRLEKEGNYGDAEQQYEAVLSAKRERCGQDSVAAATAHRDLGRVLALQRRFDRAEEQYDASVRLCTALLGEAHPNTACALTDLAAVLREQGKFSDAERFASRAVDSLRAGVGPDDVSTATALYNLAGLAKRQGKFREAEGAYSEALRIFKDRLGEGQGETADTLYQMGCLYRKRGEVGKAASFFSQAADSYSRTYGPGDKRVAEAAKRAKSMQEKTGGGAKA